MDMLQIQLKMIYRRIRITFNIIFVKRYRNEKVSLFNSDDYIIKNIYTPRISWGLDVDMVFRHRGTVKGAKKD